MAENKSILKFRGELDGIVGYYRHGKYILQRKGGFNGARIKTEARYEGTRQRQSEFGRCASIAAVFKQSLQRYLDYIPDPYVYSLIQSRMLAIKALDVISAKGEKTVDIGLQTQAGAQLLRTFSFSRTTTLSRIIGGRYKVDLQNGTVYFPGYCPATDLHFTEKNTQAVVQLALMRFDFSEACCGVSFSDLLVLSKEDVAIEDYELQAPLPEGEGQLLAVLYVGYSQWFREDLLWLRHPNNVLAVCGFEQ